MLKDDKLLALEKQNFVVCFVIDWQFIIVLNITKFKNKSHLFSNLTRYFYNTFSFLIVVLVTTVSYYLDIPTESFNFNSNLLIDFRLS